MATSRIFCVFATSCTCYNQLITRSFSNAGRFRSMSKDTPTSTSSSDPTSMSDVTAPKFNTVSVEEWKDAWQQGHTAFHKDEVHAVLKKHVDQLLHGREGLKVLVPLCGKTVDMKWLADKGHTVYGVEGVEQAVLEFFKEQELEYTKEPLSDIDGDLYKSADGRIRLYKCDFFEFGSVERGFGAIWDRGSLVAINREDREKYVKLITSLASPDCQMLIAVFVYDESKFSGRKCILVPQGRLIFNRFETSTGFYVRILNFSREIYKKEPYAIMQCVVQSPPNCVPDEVMQKLYGDGFNVKMLDQNEEINDHFRERGLTSIQEVIHLLTRK